MKRFDLLLEDGPLTGPILALNPEPHHILNAQTDAVQPNFRIHEQLIASGVSTVQAPKSGYRTALVRLSRSREENNGMVAAAWEAAVEGGLIAVSGAKTDGIDTLAKALRTAGLTVEARPKAHGKLLLVKKEADPPAVFAQWRAAAEPAPNSDGYWTQPGVFSAAKVDEGTALLVDALPKWLSGVALDLGAGWGALSQPLLSRNPGLEAVHLVETDARALAMARRNIPDPRAQFIWADATRPQTLPQRIKTVVMNPPFHEGRASEPELGAAFIRSAAACVAPKGQVLMVANRHLPYEKPLRDAFARIEDIAETGLFKVIRASKPKTRR